MSRRHTPVVIVLPVADFAVLAASAEVHGHDPYLHAHWLLAKALGVTMPVSPARRSEMCSEPATEDER